MEKFIGTTHKVSAQVTDKNTAEAVGSGTIPVFATPMMIALMEQASAELLQKHLPEGYTTVGTLVNTSHISATPLGDTVTATAKLIEANERSFVFEVEASDSVGLIGKGTHNRARVHAERFVEKTNSKI